MFTFPSSELAKLWKPHVKLVFFLKFCNHFPNPANIKKSSSSDVISLSKNNTERYNMRRKGNHFGRSMGWFYYEEVCWQNSPNRGMTMVGLGAGWLISDLCISKHGDAQRRENYQVGLIYNREKAFPSFFFFFFNHFSVWDNIHYA